MSQPIEKRIAKLRDELNRANHLYYIEARPELSDREYDKLMQELIDLEGRQPGGCARRIRNHAARRRRHPDGTQVPYATRTR